MQYTEYFLHTRTRVDRIEIQDEWIEKAIASPLHVEIQSDRRIRKWGHVEEKYLRVILLEDGETVHNAFFKEQTP